MLPGDRLFAREVNNPDLSYKIIITSVIIRMSVSHSKVEF